MSENRIAIAGYSGHGFSVAEAALSQGLNLMHYTDKSIANRNPFDLDYLGFEGDESFFDTKHNVDFILGIGDNQVRSKLFDLLISKNISVLNVIHKSAILSDYLQIGTGNFISGGVIVNALTKIGDACILNTGAIIEHECEIEDSVHIAPGAVLAGGVKVGKGTLIGANAVVLPGVKIGAECIIGSGSVVTKDVPENTIGYGNPMQIIREK